MEITKSIKIVEALAQGINPTSGELLPKESPYNDPEVIRAIFGVIHALKISRRNVRGSKKSLQEKQAENLEKGLPANAGIIWTGEEREQLKNQFESGSTFAELANEHGRTVGAIRAELKKQGLIEE